MDVNGTRYHLILGKEDWSRCSGPAGLSLFDPASESECEWNGRYNSLILQQLPFTFKGGAKSKQLTSKDRRGGAGDRFGNWFWIGEDERRIRVKLSGSGGIVQLWSADDAAVGVADSENSDFAPVGQPMQSSKTIIRGLAITDDHYLVAGMLNPSGILLFDLYSRTPPRRLGFPPGMGVQPFDCAPAPGGGAWILDRDAEAGSPWRLWRIDGNFFAVSRGQKIQTQPGAVTGFEAPDTRFLSSFPSGITAPEINGDAVAIESLPDGSAVILIDGGHDFPRVLRCSWNDALDSWNIRALAMPEKFPFDIRDKDYWSAVRPYDCAFSGAMSDSVNGSLYIVTDEGNQAFRFELLRDTVLGEYTLAAQPEYFPMRLFGGKGITALRDEIYYDFETGWVPLICQAKPRFEQTGEFITEPLDGNETDCVWHRCMFDAVIRPETSVTVWSRASNGKESLIREEWNEEPGPYKRGDGTELPFTRNSSAAIAYDTWELLFQKAKGRYLQLKCRLSGDGRTTPEVRALRIYYPRFSYLDRYLPSVYREDRDSAFFLDRFLASFEGINTSIEDRIAALQMLIDFRSAPAEALEWLAGWFTVVFDPSWDEERRRLFIHNAPLFFNYRGTLKGLLMALRLGFGNEFGKTIDDSIFTDTEENAQFTGKIKVYEHFVHRAPPRFAFSEAFNEPGPSPIDQTIPWSPSEGGKAVSSRYRTWLSNYFGIETIKATLTYPLLSPERQTLDEKLSIGQTSCAPLYDPADFELFTGYLSAQLKSAPQAPQEAAGDDHVWLSISFAGAGSITSTVYDWNKYIRQKTLAWEEFSQATFGFVPSYFAQEWTSWIRFLAGRYSLIEKLNTQYGSAYDRFESVPWPSDKPEGIAGEDWDEYLKKTEFDSGAINRRRWTQFCARRYRRIRAFNDAYGAQWDAFERLPLPYAVPSGGVALRDWYQFESSILPMHAAAHRFKVLLPLTASGLGDTASIENRLRLAQRIVETQKPAHTVFDVRFYWAAFTVGTANLGVDTIIDKSTRPPYFLTPMKLAQGYLAESFLDSPSRIERRNMITIATRIKEKSEFFPDETTYHCAINSHRGNG